MAVRVMQVLLTENIPALIQVIIQNGVLRIFQVLTSFLVHQNPYWLRAIPSSRAMTIKHLPEETPKAGHCMDAMMQVLTQKRARIPQAGK